MKTVNIFWVIVALFTCVSLFSFVTILIPTSAQAMVVRGGDSYVLESYATLEDDLYVLGETVSIAGTTTGDVFAVGSYVEHSGVISEDLFIAGGNVNITGEVQGDLRVVGGRVYISGHVTEDVIVGGGTVTIAESAIIDGDLFIFSDYFILEGTVHGLAELHVRLAEVTGTVGDNFRVGARESVSITGDAHIHGNFSYEAPRTAFISETAKIDGVVDFKQAGSNTTGERINMYSILLYILITVTSAVVLVYFFPAQTQTLVSKAMDEHGAMNLLKGSVLVVLWPILGVFLLITLFGSIPAFVLLLTYGVVFVVSMMLAPVLAGFILAKWFKKTDEALRPAWASFGAIAFTLVMYLPIIGFLVRLLLFLISFYAVSVSLSDGVWKKRKVIVENKKTAHGKKENSTEKE